MVLFFPNKFLLLFSPLFGTRLFGTHDDAFFENSPRRFPREKEVRIRDDDDDDENRTRTTTCDVSVVVVCIASSREAAPPPFRLPVVVVFLFFGKTTSKRGGRYRGQIGVRRANDDEEDTATTTTTTTTTTATNGEREFFRAVNKRRFRNGARPSRPSRRRRLITLFGERVKDVRKQFYRAKEYVLETALKSSLGR